MKAEYNFVVVGGGTAGCVLASRLSENPDRLVLLLEAGGRDRHPLVRLPVGFAKMTKGRASWGWETVPQRHLAGRRIWYTQARIIGGGSSINAQIYSRGHPADYDGWAEECSASEWRFAGVLPYFKRAEDNEGFGEPYHGVGGPLGVSNPRATLPICEAFIKACEQFGLPRNEDFNGASSDGAGFYQLTQRYGQRSSTATGHLLLAEGRSNLTVRTGAFTARILFEKNNAVGVEFHVEGKVQSVRATDGIVLSCGAIGTPKLLMLSGVGPSDQLARAGIKLVCDHQNVGKNLQDHINLSTLAECTGPHSHDVVQRLDRLLMAGVRYLLFRSGPLASSLFETGGFARISEEPERPAIQLHLGLGTGIEKGIAKLSNAGVTLNSAYLRPKSRGTVNLQDNNPFTPPLIDPNYWAEPDDLSRSLEGLRIAREILRQPALRTFIKREVLPGPNIACHDDLVRYAFAFGKTDHHPVGTCAMGSGAKSVVGPDLRVRGIENLWICDASIIPRLPSGNTNAPTIMVAEKGSDLIQGNPSLPEVELEISANANAGVT